MHPLHGNPYSLTLISINGHLHSPLIRLVDVRLSSPFCLLHNHHSLPHIVLCPWLTLMYCVKVEKSLRLLKYETIAWLFIGVVHDESIFVWRKWNMTKPYDFVGMNFLLPCYFEKTWLLRLVFLKYYYFCVNMNFCLESFGSEYSYHN